MSHESGIPPGGGKQPLFVVEGCCISVKLRHHIFPHESREGALACARFKRVLKVVKQTYGSSTQNPP